MLEASADTLFLARPEFIDHDAYLYRFALLKPRDPPVITRIPGGAAGKYAMVLDHRRQRLCE